MIYNIASSIVEFPTWNTIQKYNDTTKYQGFEFKQNLAENLYVYIDCQNENALWSDKENVICFSFCNKANFPIASARYVYSEEGYYAGIRQLLEWANVFCETFKEFIDGSTLEG